MFTSQNFENEDSSKVTMAADDSLYCHKKLRASPRCVKFRGEPRSTGKNITVR